MLASLDNIQPAADVAMTDAMLNASRMDADAAKAAVNTAAADLKQAQAENERAKLDYNRNKALYDAQLISKADYDTKKAAYDTAAAQLNQSKAKLAQAKANLDSAQGHIGQNAASLRHADDVLSKTEYRRALRWRGHQPSGSRRRDGRSRHPEFTRQHADDDGRYLADYRRSEGGRERHRQRADGPACRDHHRCHAQAEVQGHGERDRRQRRVALHRRIDVANHLQRAGSQRLQSGHRVAGSAGQSASRLIGDRAHHDRQASPTFSPFRSRR